MLNFECHVQNYLTLEKHTNFTEQLIDNLLSVDCPVDHSPEFHCQKDELPAAEDFDADKVMIEKIHQNTTLNKSTVIHFYPLFSSLPVTGSLLDAYVEVDALTQDNSMQKRLDQFTWSTTMEQGKDTVCQLDTAPQNIWVEQTLKWTLDATKAMDE